MARGMTNMSTLKPPLSEESLDNEYETILYGNTYNIYENGLQDK